jgi:hypothetical protein
MPHRRWLILIALCLLVSPIGFAVGHWSASTPRHAGITDQHPLPKTRAEYNQTAPGETTDFSSVTIENLGQVEFDQAFGLLSSAPKDALIAWTKRLEALPIGPRKTAGITAFFKTLAQIDAKTAVDLALSLKRHDPRWTAIGSISAATPAADLAEVARMYTALNEKKVSLGDLVIHWSRSDPEATARFLSAYEGDVNTEEIADLMTNWAALDPAAAREWLANQVADRRDDGVYAGFYSGWLEHDPLTALNDLRTRANDETFNKAFEVVTKDLFKKSQADARGFILTLPPSAQEIAVGGIVHDVTAIYFSGMAELQTDEVAKWLITLPEQLWHENVGEILNRWPEQDHDQRDAWIDQLPTTIRDAVLADYCRAYRPYSPTDNFRAGLRIHGSDVRQETFRGIFANMDDESRQELLAKTQLSPAEMQELAKILKRP